MRLRVPVLASAALGLAACSTIVHGGGRQDIPVLSTPSSARVVIDGQQRGVTPLVANLTRKDQHVLRVELDGYQPYEAPLRRKVSGWVWGNIVFGGLPGLAVDAITGGMYKLTPEQVQAQLANARSGSHALPGADGVYVVLVRRADPSWVKVGELQR